MSAQISENVQKAKNGDTEAFGELYSFVYKDLYRVALYTLRDVCDAQDAVSQSVCDAFRSISRLKDPDAFKSWIMKILYNNMSRKLKEYAIRNRHTASVELLENQASVYGQISPDSLDLVNAMEQLSKTERTILCLSLLDGYSSNEISSIVRVKPATVRSKLMRAKQKVKKMMGDEIS